MRSKEKSEAMCGVQGVFLRVAFYSALGAMIFSGCVRVAGSAGTWKANEEGETTVKSVGFDTNKLLPGGANDGQITV